MTNRVVVLQSDAALVQISPNQVSPPLALLYRVIQLLDRLRLLILYRKFIRLTVVRNIARPVPHHQAVDFPAGDDDDVHLGSLLVGL